MGTGETISSKLNLIDLAGSERLSRTMVGEEGEKEVGILFFLTFHFFIFQKRELL